MNTYFSCCLNLGLVGVLKIEKIKKGNNPTNNTDNRLHVARQFCMLWKIHEQTTDYIASQLDASSEDCLDVLDLKQRC